MNYKEAALWLRQNWERLPETMNGKFAYYPDVKGTLLKWSKIIKENKYQVDVDATKRKVVVCVEDLKDESTWNKPRPTWSELHNKYHS